MDLLDSIASLIALIIIEVILGIDNLVFLSILTEKLPNEERGIARRWGLVFAWVTRLLLLVLAVQIAKLTQPLFTIIDWSFSMRNLFLLIGGGFLIAKATHEIHVEVDEVVNPQQTYQSTLKTSFIAVVAQVAIMDVIFSLDSVLTAIGLTSNFWIMAIAISIAIVVMIYAVDVISDFIERHHTIKMLALSFLILIGMVLIADGFSFHVPRGYIYFAMGFSLTVEFLNLLRRKRHRNLQGK